MRTLLPLALLAAGCMRPAPVPPPATPPPAPAPEVAPMPRRLPQRGEDDFFGTTAVPGERPVAALPAHVPAPLGQVTLFADFAAAGAGGVPVYLVNRTPAPVPLNAQDGDLYLKLEYEAAPGEWARAQGHGYSFCGNSYSRHELGAGRFVVIPGHRPAAGDPVLTRYRLYGQPVGVGSNPGPGRIDRAEARKAEADAMAVRTGDFEELRRIALDPRVPVDPGDRFTGGSRGVALQRLADGTFDQAQVEKVLAEVAGGPDKELAALARRLQRKLGGDDRDP